MAQAVVELKKGAPDVRLIPIPEIDASGNVREWSKDELEKVFGDSVAKNGISEPLLVTPRGNKFRLVYGFGRLGAAKLAGLKEVPAQVQDLTDDKVRELQLTENLFRKEMSAEEEGHAYALYLKETNATETELAQRIGKSQSHVSKRIGLTRLPKAVGDAIRQGIMTPAHAEVLAAAIPKEMSENERKDFIAEALFIAKDNDIPAKEFAGELKYAVQEWTQEHEWAVRLEKAKFSVCPKCKDRATGGDAKVLTDRFGHRWNPETGEYVKGSGYQGAAASAPPAPKKTIVTTDAQGRTVRKEDRTEGPTTRSFHEVYAITKRIVEQLDGHVDAVTLSTNYGGGNLQIRFAGKYNPVHGADFVASEHKYSTGERTEVQVTAWDKNRRKGMKQAFHAWETKALPKLKVKRKELPPAKVAALKKALEGSVDDVLRRLPKLDVEGLEVLRELEAKGKKRNGVFALLDGRIRDKSRA